MTCVQGGVHVTGLGISTCPPAHQCGEAWRVRTHVMCVCRRGSCQTCMCVDRGVYVEVRVSRVCGCVCVHVFVDPACGVPVCVFHCPCTAGSSSPPKPPGPGPLKAHSTSRPPQLHAPRCSVHQCVLDQEKSKTSGGTPVPGPPSSHPLCCVTRMGGFSPAPSTICCFPRSLRPEALRGVPDGAPQGKPRLHTLPCPPRRACVGVAVMASVDIL